MPGKFISAAAALLIAVSAAPSTAAAAKPDLVVKFSTSNGRVNLRNEGNKRSKKTVVTIVCQKIAGAGSCPNPNPALVAPYENPAFPGAATVNFRPLQPGQRKNHLLSFFGGLAFTPGTYRFTLIADASNTNVESNEGNNVAVVIKTVP